MVERTVREAAVLQAGARKKHSTEGAASALHATPFMAWSSIAYICSLRIGLGWAGLKMGLG